MDALTDWEFGRLIYLVLLGSALLFWFMTQNRQSLSRTVQQALAWVFIFIGVIAVVGLWEDIRSTVSPAARATVTENRIEVPRARDGHYYLTLLVDETPVEFLIDTGASQVILSADDATRIGVDTERLSYFGRAMTANGEVRTAPVQLDSVAIGPVSDRAVEAWVTEGDLDQSLLGMNYLQRWNRIEIADGALVLSR